MKEDPNVWPTSFGCEKPNRCLEEENKSLTLMVSAEAATDIQNVIAVDSCSNLIRLFRVTA